jgi:phosphoserine phosphatase
VKDSNCSKTQTTVQVHKASEVPQVMFQGLVVFDVDGTLIREKTVCELIAEKIDRVERMDWLERNAGSPKEPGIASRNESIVAAREEMAGWYIEAGEETVESFIDSVIWAEGAHSGIASLIDDNWLVAIASLTWSFGVEIIARDLGIYSMIATYLNWNSKKIDHIFAEDKADFLQQLTYEHRIPEDRVFAVGDSGGDVPMLEVAPHGFYLGTTDPQIPGIVHLPNAGIDTIAQLVINPEK